jgi:hypothetical protein
MDRRGGNQGDPSTPPKDTSSGGGRTRTNRSKDPNLMTPDEFRREIKRIWAKAGKMTKKERLAAAAAARGTWKDRPEWKGMTAIQIAAELRRSALGRGRNG